MKATRQCQSSTTGFTALPLCFHPSYASGLQPAVHSSSDLLLKVLVGCQDNSLQGSPAESSWYPAYPCSWLHSSSEHPGQQHPTSSSQMITDEECVLGPPWRMGPVQGNTQSGCHPPEQQGYPSLQ